MQFKSGQVEEPNKHKYTSESLDLAYKFSGKLMKEFGTFVKAITLFGSTVKGGKEQHDIDVLIIVDDTSIIVSPEIAEAYRVIIEKLIAETSPKLHVTTLRLTTFWEYIRAGDPIGVNMVRESHIIMDSGFFRPLQALLVQGRVRPSPEAIWAYFSRSSKTLTNSRWHLLEATLDLYWAVIDSAHAALMKAGHVPPSPSHVAEALKLHLESKKHIPKGSAKTMDHFYKLMKGITHRKVKDVHGKEYEVHHKKAHSFVRDMQKFIDKAK